MIDGWIDGLGEPLQQGSGGILSGADEWWFVHAPPFPDPALVDCLEQDGWRVTSCIVCRAVRPDGSLVLGALRPEEEDLLLMSLRGDTGGDV